MTITTRTVTITYGSFSVGSTSEFYMPAGFHEVYDGIDEGRLSFSVRVRGATSTDYGTKLAAFKAGFLQRQVATTVVIGSSTIINWSHSGNTGYNSIAQVTKPGTLGDCPSAATWLVSITVQKPFTQTSYSGRLSGSFQVTEDASAIRTAFINATYTAQPAGNAAYAQYVSAFAAWVEVCRVILSVSYWECIGKPTIHIDEANKRVNVTAMYRELIYDQSLVGRDNSAIVSATLSITTSPIYPGDYQGDKPVRRLAPVHASWTCSVNKDVTTDLDTLFDSTIKPFCVTKTMQALGVTSGALMGYTYSKHPYSNTIVASFTFQCENGSSLVSRRISVRTSRKLPVELVPTTGRDPLQKYKLRSFDSIRLFVQAHSTWAVGGVGVSSGFSAGGLTEGAMGRLWSGDATTTSASGPDLVYGENQNEWLFPSVAGAKLDVLMFDRDGSIEEIGEPPYTMNLMHERTLYIAEYWKEVTK